MRPESSFDLERDQPLEIIHLVHVHMTEDICVVSNYIFQYEIDVQSSWVIMDVRKLELDSLISALIWSILFPSTFYTLLYFSRIYLGRL